VSEPRESRTTVYGLANCDKVRNTLTCLRNWGQPFQFHDFRRDGTSPSLIRKFLDHFSLDELVNRRGTTWRNLSAGERDAFSGGQALTLLCEQPALMQRPIVISGDNAIIGFDARSLRRLVDH